MSIFSPFYSFVGASSSRLYHIAIKSQCYIRPDLRRWAQYAIIYLVTKIKKQPNNPK